MFNRKAKKTIFLGLLAIYLVASLFGVFHIGMSDMNGKMENCPFEPGVACLMSPLEHVGAALTMLRLVPLANILLFVLTLGILALTLLSFGTTHLELSDGPPPRRSTFFISRSPLALAFSQGILNPKIF